MAETVIYRYANDGSSLGILKYREAVHEESLSGDDRLTVVCDYAPNKRDKLVWKDNSGTWHEHSVDKVEYSRSGSKRITVTCSNSIQELYGTIVELEDGEGELSGNVHHILTELLKGTRWTAGSCSNKHFGKQKLEVYHKSVRECIGDLVDMTFGEMVTSVTVDEKGVQSRTVRIVAERGSKTVQRAFTYGRNMGSSQREVEYTKVYTAVVGYGAKANEEAMQERVDDLANTDTSHMSETEKKAHQKKLKQARADLSRLQKNEYAPRLTKRVHSSLSLSKWGVPLPDGTFAHNWYTYTDANNNDEDDLRDRCEMVLAAVSRLPFVYRFEVDAGDNDSWKDVKLGNRVLVIDTDMGTPTNDEIMRVSYIKRRLSRRNSCVIEIGDRTNEMLSQMKATERVTRAATGNKSRVAAKHPQKTGGNYSAGDYNYADDGSFDTGTEIPSETTPVMPTAINITVLPDKLNYIAGETIDFSGIEVQAMNGDAVWENESYPDGYIPFNQLKFPQTRAGSGKATSATSDIAEIQEYMPLPLAEKISGQMHSGMYDHWHDFSYPRESGAKAMVGFTRNDNGDVVLSFSPYGLQRINASDEPYGNLRYTRDGKTVYYTITNNLDNYKECTPVVTKYFREVAHQDLIAWTMIYGEIGYGDTIPVQWDYNGQTFETSFKINIQANVMQGAYDRVRQAIDDNADTINAVNNIKNGAGNIFG